ncbi:MAG: ATP-binding protein, partial [Armatimonadetes bacterium]|nr:ATP-binding protein [Armatimonadota bacterium]
LIALSIFSSKVEGAVLVFEHGCWRPDEELFEDIQSSTFDNLILPSGMVNTVIEDVQQWLSSKELYESHGVPWKRGLILFGPPGNGKTHMIKALVNHFKLTALYVRSFKAQHRQDAQNISAVFDRARECAPCILIFEDIDTLVGPENRSFFLNELDGFAKNCGILVLASANDPGKLDPALVNRPSRFDRRHEFGLPALTERSRYLTFFTSALNSSLRLSPEEAEKMGAETEGFSFAYLKELVLSSMMAWISKGEGKFADVMLTSIGALRDQMEYDPVPTPVVASVVPSYFGIDD